MALTIEAQEAHHDLTTLGWTTVPHPMTDSDLDQLVHDFDALVHEVGREELAQLTYGNVTGRRGGEYGFVRRVDRIESKDAFMLRSVEPDLDLRKLPKSLRDFMRDGREVVRESEVAFNGVMSALEPHIPGTLDFHFRESAIVDASVRVVLSDDDSDVSRVVAEPHLDISSMTMHLRTNRPGTFFIVQPDGQIIFPDPRDGQATLFNGAWFAQTEAGSSLKPVFHGAVSGDAQDGKRRGIVVAQIQPNLAITTPPPSYESTHSDNLDELQKQVVAAYTARTRNHNLA